MIYRCPTKEITSVKQEMQMEENMSLCASTFSVSDSYLREDYN